MELFEITVDDREFTVNPGNLKDGLYLILLGGANYACIQRDENEDWVKIDPLTKLAVSDEYNEHLNAIGNQIDNFYYYRED